MLINRAIDPVNGMCGGALTGTQTYLAASFASLGPTVSDHAYTLNSSDAITVRFAYRVPLPASLPLTVAALAALALVRRRSQS